MRKNIYDKIFADRKNDVSQKQQYLKSWKVCNREKIEKWCVKNADLWL